MQDLGHDGWGGVQEFEVVLLCEEVGGARVDGGVGGERFGRAPQDVVVVGQVGEEDAEEEAGGCYLVVRIYSDMGDGWRCAYGRR